jgi:dienelactone hydrolase
VHELARHGCAAAAAPDLYHRQPDDGADTMTRAGRLRDDEILADVDARGGYRSRPTGSS